MTTVDIVVDAKRRRVSNKNVNVPPMHYFVPQKLRRHPPDAMTHLAFGKLVSASVIPHTAPQSRNDQIVTLIIDDFSVDVISPVFRQDLKPLRCGIIIEPRYLSLFRKLPHAFKIMVPEYKIKILVQCRNDELIIFQGKIPRADNEIHVSVPLGDIFRVNQWIRLIADTQDLHASPHHITAIDDNHLPRHRRIFRFEQHGGCHFLRLHHASQQGTSLKL